MRNKIKILDCHPDVIQKIIMDLKQPSFRGKQLCSWLFEKAVTDPDLMINIPKDLRVLFKEKLDLSLPELVEKRVCEDGSVKFLNGEGIESVLIKAGRRNTLCLSTQAGCKFGCAFCASSKAGFDRNLSTGEIISQVVYGLREVLPEKLNNIVYMGIGEPFDNFENTVNSIEIISSDKAFRIGQRKITVSTCGVVPGILRFADLNKQYELSVSLHCANNIKRNKIMPVINKRYPLNKLMQACKYFFDKTRRYITFEYIVIKGFNDGIKDIKDLIDLLKGFSCKINLIPFNPAIGTTFEVPEKEKVLEVGKQLKNAGMDVTVRWPKGADVDAACGQLRYLRKAGKIKD